MLSEYSNSVLAAPPLHTSLIETLAFTTLALSAEVVGTFSPLLANGIGNATTVFDFGCTILNARFAFVWIDDHVICQHGAYNNSANGLFDAKNFTLRKKTAGLVVRAHLYRDPVAAADAAASLVVEWCPRGSQCTRLPLDTLDAALPPPELARRELQTKLTSRWGSWLHRDILSVVLLPDSAAIIVQLCHLPSKFCLSSTGIDGNGGSGSPPVRVGAHAIDHSYSQTFVSFLGLNVSIEYAVGPDPRALDLTVTPQAGEFDAAYYAIAFAGRFAWGRVGTFEAAPDGLSFSGSGLGNVRLIVTSPPLAPNSLYPVLGPGDPGGFPCSGNNNCASEECTCNEPGCIGFCTSPPQLTFFAAAFTHDAAPIGLTTDDSSITLTDILGRISTARAIDAVANARFGDDLASLTLGVTAALGWRNVFAPIETGSFMPTTYGFSWISPSPSTEDHAYVLFAWDNCFASYTAGVLGASAAAYSNLIAIVRAKTNDGYVPNWASGGSKADQAEPAVCSRVLLELFQRFNDTWIVELLLDDLIDWSDWQYARRRLVVPGNGSFSDPGFITVGSDYSTCVAAVDCVNDFKGESGLDQSPKWDCIGAAPDGSGGSCVGMAINGSRILQMGEVQSTTLFAVDAAALAILARAVNRTADALHLEGRAAALRAQLPKLWDTSQSAFADLYPSGLFSSRLTPTIFYPLMARAASADQATMLVTSHLLNASEFCVSAEWENNPETCYWGLPSVSAADSAFMEPLSYVYWRGETWAPMAMLTWWALDEYSTDEPIVKDARAALAAQKAAQFQRQWDYNRNVCENASPYRPNSTIPPGINWIGVNKSNAECTGWGFYTWGNLNGLLAILETGA